jgi:hypothetical protein
MKKIATTLGLLALLAGSANAGGINLGQGDCWLTGATNAVNNACTSNTGSALTLFITVVPPVAVNNFNNVECVIDVQSGTSALPDWWQLASGGCRAGAASAATITGGANCLDIWGGDAIGVLAFAPPNFGPLRIRLLPVVGSPTEYPITTTDELAVAKVTISRTKSTGAGSCTGCSEGACIVLNSVLVGQPATSAFDQLVSNPIENQHVLYNAGVAGCPGIIPVRSTTWGQVKALYR